MNSHTQDIVLTHWLRWSEALAEEGGVPTTSAALSMFCDHLRSVQPSLLGEMGGPATDQIKVWIAEDYLP